MAHIPLYRVWARVAGDRREMLAGGHKVGLVKSLEGWLGVHGDGGIVYHEKRFKSIFAGVIDS